MLTEFAYFGLWQPGCAEYFPTKDLAGAQLVQIKVLYLNMIFWIVGVTYYQSKFDNGSICGFNNSNGKYQVFYFDVENQYFYQCYLVLSRR